MKELISKYKTERLIVTDSIIEECDELQKICESWDDKELIEGTGFKPDYINKCITEGDLPPVVNASKENYRLKSIYMKDTSELVGLTDLYYGYPTEESAWISIFLIDKQFRKKGYAQEVINLISNECKLKGYNKIGIGVYLKNWRGLRFWTKAGFDKVFGIFGDDTYAQNTFAMIGLETSI